MDVREPPFFYRSSPSSKLEEAAPYTQIGHSHALRSSRCNHKQQTTRCHSREVAQGWLNTTADIDLYLNPDHLDPELTPTVVGSRSQQGLSQLDKSGTPTGVFQQVPGLWETTWPHGAALAQHLIHGDQGRVHPYYQQSKGLTPPTKGSTAFEFQLQKEGVHNPQETFLEQGAHVI